MMHLALFLFVLGVILLVTEIIIPGFGFPGISGIICLIVSSIIILLKLPFGIFVVFGEVIFVVSLIAGLLQYLKRNQNAKKIILDECLNDDINEFGELDSFLGKVGVTLCPLKPFGKADFNGVRFDVYSEGRYISEGRKVKIIDTQKHKIIVKEIN